MACKLHNTFAFQTYVHQLGQRDTYDPVFSYHLPVEAVREALEQQGTILKTVAIPYALDEDGKRTLRSILPAGILRRHRRPCWAGCSAGSTCSSSGSDRRRGHCAIRGTMVWCSGSSRQMSFSEKEDGPGWPWYREQLRCGGCWYRSVAWRRFRQGIQHTLGRNSAEGLCFCRKAFILIVLAAYGLPGVDSFPR